MTNTQTKRINHYYLGMLTVLAMVVVAALLLTATPSYASTTFTVDSTADTQDLTPGLAGDVITLRDAIARANSNNNPSEVDRIDFDIPGPGVHTISPGSALPTITEPVIVDGYTQPGASPNTKAVGNDASLKIELNGTNAPSADGLWIADASNCAIKGLIINRFLSAGIFVSGKTVGTRIQGNFIGTNPTGTIDRGNKFAGVDIEGTSDGSSADRVPSQAVVGGTTPAARNLISGNGSDGIFMGSIFSTAQQADSLRVQGNYIGTDRSGTKALGNDGTGLYVQFSTGTTIGGKTSASRNVISGNGRGGVEMFLDSDTRMLGNRIGTTASGTGALGNGLTGVFIEGGTPNNSIGDGTAAGSNTIAFNEKDGVAVFSGTGHEISRNSIFSNGGLGIDLLGEGEDFFADIPTPNDPADADTGANNLQNKPVLSSARNASGKTAIKGRLSSNANQTFAIEFYANPADTNEGKTFIGEKTVTATVDGLASFTFTPATRVAAGQTITATATNTSTHDTSEFSAPRTVVSS